MRCTRCGRVAQDADKFCAECGLFLRDAYVDHRLLLALAYERDGKTPDARREMERLLKAEPNHPLANHLMGTILFHEGLLEQAVMFYQRAIQDAPRFVRCYYDLGVCCYYRGNMPEAIKAYESCLELDPEYRAAYYRLGLALFHAGELDRAEECFEKSSSLTPEFLLARYFIGVIQERRGNRAAAAREFERSIEEGIGESSSLFHLAKIRDAEGHTREATELLKQARQFKDAHSNST